MSEKPEYFAIRRKNQKGMLLYSLPDPGDDDDWFAGRRFSEPPRDVLEVEIQSGSEQADPLPFFGAPPVMSGALRKILIDCGVGNVDFYPAVLSSEDGTIRHEGYFAYNVVGLVRAADLEATTFAPENPSRFLDGSIEGLAVDLAAARQALLFRLAESAGTILVHRKVKEAIERAGLPFIAFQTPSELTT